MENAILARIVAFFVDKKKIIGWVSAALIAVTAAGAGLKSEEVKAAICGTQEAPK